MTEESLIFRGTPAARGAGAGSVTIDDHPLDAYFDECNHSPDGFSWGFGGSGPSQLAYAMIRETLRRLGFPNDEAKYFSQRLHQKFKWDVVAKFPQNLPFVCSMNRVQDWIDEYADQTHADWKSYSAYDS